MKLFLATLVLILSFSVNAGLVHDFTQALQEKCEGSSTLLIKKVLIELNKGISCNKVFCKKLVSNCSQIEESQIIAIYVKTKNSYSGAIIGE